MARVSGMEETEALRWQETEQGEAGLTAPCCPRPSGSTGSPGPALSYNLEQAAEVSCGLRNWFSGRQTLHYLALRPVILGFKSLQAERMDRMWAPRGQSWGPGVKATGRHSS